MRKGFVTGFTLAEVLITLTIIGVIAALTIPSLITNIEDAQYKTAWKRTYSIINQATNRIMTDNGGTIKGLFQTNQDMMNYYGSYLSYTKECINDNSCWHLANNWFWYDKTPVSNNEIFGFILNNGSIISPVLKDPNCASTQYTGNILNCGWIFVDVNGFKGPNTIDKDIFYIYIRENGILPRGVPGDVTGQTICPQSGGCSAKYLYQ